ncbi:hypothetical protein ACFPM7_10870 [Actinokineospora guangxiensis]|uniref:Transcriptional regulator, AbiEi antitoxin, Type IV TA system n=1 Tax=Actinokineospora guangxiensis TaxID=1490288 RepID=A0ABW0ENF8_9PSEU
MTNHALLDLDRLPRLFPHGVARTAELSALGITDEHIHRCCGPDGPWRRLPDGVVLLSQAAPARTQRLQAAVGVAAPGAVVTGREAMWLHGVPLPSRGAIHLLVDGRSAERNDGSVVIERVRRLPQAQWRRGFPVVPLAKATVDACLRTPSFGEMRVLVLEAVQRCGLTVDSLSREVSGDKRKGIGALRAVLAERNASAKALRARRAKQVVALAGLPEPRWNARLATRADVHLGLVDAWWPEVGLAWDAEIHDAWDPRTAAAAAARQARFLGAGVIPVHTDPARLAEHTEAVAAELRAVYDFAARTPQPEVRADR